MTFVVSGRLRMKIGDETCEIGPMSIVHIPSGVEHGAEALEDSVLLDIFHPRREDFLERIGQA